MEKGLPPVNYSTWQHIPCSKFETGGHKKKKKNQAWLSARDFTAALHLSCPPVIPTDTCALSCLCCLRHIKRRLKLKVKTRRSQVRLSPVMTIIENYRKVLRISLCFWWKMAIVSGIIHPYQVTVGSGVTVKVFRDFFCPWTPRRGSVLRRHVDISRRPSTIINTPFPTFMRWPEMDETTCEDGCRVEASHTLS